MAQCLTIAQSVLILIGALKKAGNGAVEGVVDKYYCDLTLYIQQIYRALYPTHTDIVYSFHRSEMSTAQIMILISFDTKIATYCSDVRALAYSETYHASSYRKRLPTICLCIWTLLVAF